MTGAGLEHRMKRAPLCASWKMPDEGQYVDGVWRTTRILNGDQTDRGLNFRGANPPLVRIRLHTLPLYDEAVHRKVE